ncbi:hypothetical protein FACS189427_03880 [Planctomycetales bacterium]|nr:hypothetical protein FACS189427_03880 [Planctomycetales bacterium]
MNAVTVSGVNAVKDNAPAAILGDLVKVLPTAVTAETPSRDVLSRKAKMTNRLKSSQFNNRHL